MGFVGKYLAGDDKAVMMPQAMRITHGAIDHIRQILEDSAISQPHPDMDLPDGFPQRAVLLNMIGTQGQWNKLFSYEKADKASEKFPLTMFKDTLRRMFLEIVDLQETANQQVRKMVAKAPHNILDEKSTRYVTALATSVQDIEMPLLVLSDLIEDIHKKDPVMFTIYPGAQPQQGKF